MKLTLEQYINYYKRNGRLPSDLPSQVRSNALSDRALRSHYERYVKKLVKRDEKQAAKRPNVYSHHVTGLSCRLLTQLTPTRVHLHFGEDDGFTLHLDELLKNAGMWLKKVDPAHVFGRGAFPHLADDPQNIIPLNRYSHGMLDRRCHPTSGKPITPEQHRAIWRYLVGADTYDSLEEKARAHQRTDRQT